MDKITVSVLHESHSCPAGFMMFLAKLTQRGHKVKSEEDLLELYNKSMFVHDSAAKVAKLPHGTIKRFTPITIAVIGASRRFLTQARTHSVGLEFVSASMQYSDYSEYSQFVVPYDVIEDGTASVSEYKSYCFEAFTNYNKMAKKFGHDNAGYLMPHALRNILIIQGNHESWMNFVNKRACRRNTDETRYVAYLIWKALLGTNDGKEMFSFMGPDCQHGKCREGSMSCNNPVHLLDDEMKRSWPLI